PISASDGDLVLDKAGAPAGNDTFIHTGLADWTTYYYSAFAHDLGPNYSVVAQAAATPRPQSRSSIAVISTLAPMAGQWTCGARGLRPSAPSRAIRQRATSSRRAAALPTIATPARAKEAS